MKKLNLLRKVSRNIDTIENSKRKISWHKKIVAEQFVNRMYIQTKNITKAVEVRIFKYRLVI